MHSLRGRRAIVTGAASGIGAATARLLGAAGAAVVVADLDAAGAIAVAAAIQAAGGQAEALKVDVTRAEDCRAAVGRCVSSFGGLEILVNCAGIIRRADVVETTEAEWDQVMAVNVKSIFLMAKAAVPQMAGADGAAIVNVGSGWGLKGGPRAASYCASKGAVVNLTRAMAIDHGPQGIRVNCVCPGDTDTPMLRSEARQLGEDESAFLASSAERPLARLGTPDDIGQAVVYLLSDAAGWVTGSTLVVDGGGLA
ncbi:MAG TPA: glucose 1-dehydrogenase [Candidatus Limnocylindrales bacterium]|nr:glucose 1-dehydrogenase [Candidatus Limnocylindrales bacterium]